jgi:predicted phage terminase large subunit-like protein
MYQQRPVPIEGGFFKSDWIQYYDPDHVPDMDVVIQSWDTAQTKSSTSDYVVGQIWGRIGADFYLLNQVRGRWDFDETVQAIKAVSNAYKQSSAKIVEAQTLGAALSSHLKHKIPGLIPINVRGTKELRAFNALPVWQSKNVYIPRPDDGDYAWVYDYGRELLNFPNAEHDDQVDATTLALNQLRGSLFDDLKAAAVPAQTINTSPLPEHYYYIGYIPARQDDDFTVLVFDITSHDVLLFEKRTSEPIENQILTLFETARRYNNAVVRAFDMSDNAILSALEMKGVYLERVKLTKAEMAAAFENLSMLISKDMVTFPQHPQLLAELEVFKSEFTWTESPDYTLQIAAQSAISAMCLVTYDLSPELIKYQTQPSIYYSYDPDIFIRP